LNEGGLQSIPKLVFPGGALIGCSAGFLNVPKIKGSHTAMKSGMLAAAAAVAALATSRSGGGDSRPPVPDAYPDAFKSSWVHAEPHRARNLRPAAARWGMKLGMLYGGLDLKFLGGKAPWTLHHKHADHETLKLAA